MALNFGILQPVNIGGNIMAGRQEAQRNELAQQQLAANQQQMQTSAMQQEKMQLEMADFKAKQAGLDKFLAMSQANGKTGTPEELASSFYDFALTQRDPQLIMAAQTMRQAATERSAYNASRQPPKISPVGPAPGALGSGSFGMDQNTLGSGAFDFGQQSAPVLQPNVPGTAVSTPVRPMAAAPMVNQLAPPPAAVAPVNQLGVDTTALENRIIDLRTNYPNVPQAQKEADRLEKQLDESRKLYTVGGNLVTGAGKPIFTAPKEVTESEFERNLAKTNLTETEKTALRVARAKKESTQAPGTTINIDQKQEGAFATGLGKGQADRIIASQVAAQDAVAIIDTVKTGRDIMKSGMITGAGAEFLVNLNQGLKTAGIDAGYADASANSQAFAANMAANVGKLIKQFGAGTGLSDDDRKFATDMAGGRISLDAKAINRILSINEKAARNTITRHNKDVKGIKTNIPLEVEMPPEDKTPAPKNVVTNPQFPGFSIGKP